MSNEVNETEKLIEKENDFGATQNLRANDLQAEKPKFQIKPPIPNPSTNPAAHAPVEKERLFSAAEVVEISKQIENRLREEIQSGSLKTGATQVISKDKVPVKQIDYTKLTMDDIFDLSIPIQAKTFGATDALRVDLIDKNYEPRWVNKNPRRLGQFLSYGFVYVERQDLAKSLEVEVMPDASGHFSLDDVVLMRIPKELYYSALRAAHERAVKTVNQVQAAAAGEREASEYMARVGGAEYADAVAQNKIGFYRPGIEI